MTGNSKRDPLIRALVIIIIGTIAFGLLFNLFIGGGSMNHMGGMGGSSGYGIDAFLGGLLVLLVKLLMVVLVIAVVVGVVMWIKNNFFKNVNPGNINTSQFMQAINKDPILKTVSLITLAILGIILLHALLGSFMNPGMAGNMGGYHGAMGGGFSPALSIAGLITLLIKVLSFVLVISLILALVAYLKKQYDAGAFNFANTNAQGNQGTNTTAGTQPGDSNNNNPQ